MTPTKRASDDLTRPRKRSAIAIAIAIASVASQSYRRGIPGFNF
ncbi:hypothetical protein TW65_06553 [Stemphylium lycopersici]|nr:hypothetical protein TW65_06553 [Stemphylium lycopersici]